MHLPNRCGCRRRPPLRVYEAMVEAARHLPPDAPLQSWQCRCGEIHCITAADVLDAA